MTLQDGVVDVIILIVCLIALRCAFVLARRHLSVHEQSLQLSEREQLLDVQEREAALALTEATAPQRAEFEQAQLQQRAAQARVATTIAGDPQIVDARRLEELAVIKAREAARVAYIQEHGADDDGAIIEALMVGYEASIAMSYHTYDSWFGNANISGLSLDAIERIIAAYIASLRKSYHTFASWYGRINPRLFQ